MCESHTDTGSGSSIYWWGVPVLHSFTWYLSLAAFPCLVFKGSCHTSCIRREEPGILALKKQCPVCHLQVKNLGGFSYFSLSFPWCIHFIFSCFLLCSIVLFTFPAFLSLHFFPCVSLSFSVNYYIHYVNIREPFVLGKIWTFFSLINTQNVETILRMKTRRESADFQL